MVVAAIADDEKMVEFLYQLRDEINLAHAQAVMEVNKLMVKRLLIDRLIHETMCKTAETAEVG